MEKKLTYEELEQKIRVLEVQLDEQKQVKNASKGLKKILHKKEKIISEKKILEKIIELSSSIIAGLSYDRKIQIFNFEAEKLSGYTKEQVLGLDSFDIFSPVNSKDKLNKVWKEAWGAPSFSYISQILTKSGDEKIISWRISGLYEDENIANHLLILIGEDITGLKQSEEKFKEQNLFLRNILESLTHPFIIIDAEDYTITMENSVAAGNHDSMKTKCHSISHNYVEPCQDPEYQCPLEIVKKTKKPTVVEHIHFDKEGKNRFVEVHGYPIFDKNQNVKFMIEYCLDITERKTHEVELLKSEAKLRSIINSVDDLVFGLDLKGNFLDYYKSSENAKLYVPESRFIGKHFSDIIPPHVTELVESAIKKISVYGKTQEIEYSLEIKGKINWFSAKISPRLDRSGSISGFTVVARDVTLQKEMEIQLKKYLHSLEDIANKRRKRIQKLEMQSVHIKELAATGRMAAQIAHEINNPLAGIKNSFLLIKDAVSKDHPYFKFVNKIENEIDNVSRIVRQMFNIYSPDQRTLHEFSARTMVEDIIAMLSSNSRMKTVDIKIRNLRPDIMLKLPEGSVCQVFFNLIKNAIEVSPQKGIIEIFGKTNKQTLTINIKDQGPGILKKNYKYILKPFFTTKSNEDDAGLGLGLSISKSILDDLNSRLDFKSEEGKGTTFIVTLPRYMEKNSES